MWVLFQIRREQLFEDPVSVTTVCPAVYTHSHTHTNTQILCVSHLYPFPLPLPFVTHYKHPNQLEQMIMPVLHFEHGKLCNIFSTKLGGP